MQKAKWGNDMIESKLKANNSNRGQLFRPCWVSSARCSSWSTDIHILTKMVMTSDETQIQILANRPFLSSLVPLFQSESKCETILMKML